MCKAGFMAGWAARDAGWADRRSGRAAKVPGRLSRAEAPWAMVRACVAVAALAGLLGPSRAAADVFDLGQADLKNLEFVLVADPGNAPDIYPGYNGNVLGAVAYTYQMGKYDVTAAQYCQFLNAVATQSDPFGLYSAYMAPGSLAPCGIVRSGEPGNYSYAVAQGKYTVNNGNFPVNMVSWGDAARFCNWLTNGQPVAPQGPGTTETGSYNLTSTTGTLWDPNLMLVTREPGARYVIPTEDEWYKAAYYKGGSTNAGYWFYTTESNSHPSNVLSSTGTNNANFYNAGYTDPVNYLTEVGAFASSPGPYGTFDMGGDVWEWNETSFGGKSRGLRGGWFGYDFEWGSPDGDYADALESRNSTGTSPEEFSFDIGFRVAEVPEPASLLILALIFSCATLRRRRAR